MPKLPNKSHAQKQMDYTAAQTNLTNTNADSQQTVNNRTKNTKSNSK